MKSRIPALFCLLMATLSFFLSSCKCNCEKNPDCEDCIPENTIFVRPGDANNDGKVNGYDILTIGQYFGDSVPARQFVDTTFTAQIFSGLTNSFPRYYADCNGDGVINQLDVDVVVLHFGKTHNAGTLTVSPSPISTALSDSCTINFLQGPNQTSLDTFDIDAGLGSIDIPLDLYLGDSIYGFAYTFYLPSIQYSLGNPITIPDTTGVLGVTSNNLVSFNQTIPINNKIEVAYTGNTQQNFRSRRGGGGGLTIIVDDFKTMAADTQTVYFEVKDFRIIKADGTVLPAPSIRDSLVLIKQ